MPQLKSGQCWSSDRNNSLLQTWQFDIKEKYSWFSPRAFFKGGLCHDMKHSAHAHLWQSAQMEALWETSQTTPTPTLQPPSRAVIDLFLTQRTLPGLLPLSYNKYVFALFCCRTCGWREDILVIIKRENYLKIECSSYHSLLHTKFHPLYNSSSTPLNNLLTLLGMLFAWQIVPMPQK